MEAGGWKRSSRWRGGILGVNFGLLRADEEDASEKPNSKVGDRSGLTRDFISSGRRRRGPKFPAEVAVADFKVSLSPDPLSSLHLL